MEHETYREWIDLEVDGALGDDERAGLAVHLERCSECRDERRRLIAVAERLRSDRIEVRPGFAAEVMAALEPAPWQATAPRAWRLPIALLLVCGLGSALFWNLAGGAAAGSAGASTALAALVDLFRAGLLAGSGLALASWSGIGSGVAEWLDAVPVRWPAAVVAVVGLNYFAFRLMRSRRAERVVERDRS